jgi:hypothetical protein
VKPRVTLEKSHRHFDVAEFFAGSMEITLPKTARDAS